MTLVDILNIDVDIEIFYVAIDIKNLPPLHTLYGTRVDRSIIGNHLTMVETVNINVDIEKFNIETDTINITHCHLRIQLLLSVLHSWLCGSLPILQSSWTILYKHRQ